VPPEKLAERVGVTVNVPPQQLSVGQPVLLANRSRGTRISLFRRPSPPESGG
jgi:hypothetical protein